MSILPGSIQWLLKPIDTSPQTFESSAKANDHLSRQIGKHRIR